MDHSPKHCASPVCSFNDLFIGCEGVCSQRFHAVCVGLSIADVVAISSSQNLFWLCDACRDHLRTGRTTVALRSEVDIGGKEKENACASSSCMFLDDFVQCDGQCRKEFHASCVHLGKLDLLVIVSSVNVLWFCDGCKKQVQYPVRDELDKEPVELSEEQKEDNYVVSRLETKFVDVIEKLNQISEHLEHGSPPKADQNFSAENPVLKGPEDEPAVEASKTIEESPLKPCDGDCPMKELDNDTVVKASEAVIEAPEKDVKSDRKEVDSESSEEEGLCSEEDVPMTDKEANSKNDTTKNVPIFVFKATKAESAASRNFSFSKQTESSKQFQKNLAQQAIKKPMPKPIKLENDENNNPPEPKKPLLVEAPAVPSTVVKQETSSTFSLWIRFSDPEMSEGTARQAIRNALGMTAVDPILVRNVIPAHVDCPIFAAFKVEMEARWKSAALASATWRSTSGYMQHREWLR